MYLSCDHPSLFLCNLSLSATLPQQGAFPTIYSPSGLLYLQLSSMRAREVLMEPRSYHSPGEGWCGAEDERKEDGAVDYCNFADMSVWMEKSLQMLRGRPIKSHFGSCAEPHAFSHSFTGSHGPLARSRYPPPLKFCHRTSTVISFGPCSADISVMQEFGVHTPVICFKADLLDWGNPYVNSALFTRCVQAYSFEITSVKRPGCFGNAVKTESGPSRFSLPSSSFSSSSFSTLMPVSPRLCD